MTSSFRTAGAWGAGLGRPLTWVEQDNNTYDKETRITAIETAGVAVGIDYIEVIGDQMTIHMTDASLQGPFTLPSADAWNPQGYWLPAHVYQALDTVQYAGGLYLVLVDHTSDSTFDPDAMEDTVPRYHLIANFAPAQGFTQTGATFTPDLGDANAYHRLTNVSGCAVTIDPTVAFADWTEFHFRDASIDTGASCTFAVDSPGSINDVTGFANETAGSGATVTLKKVGATDAWDIMGLLMPLTA